MAVECRDPDREMPRLETPWLEELALERLRRRVESEKGFRALPSWLRVRVAGTEVECEGWCWRGVMEGLVVFVAVAADGGSVGL